MPESTAIRFVHRDSYLTYFDEIFSEGVCTIMWFVNLSLVHILITVSQRIYTNLTSNLSFFKNRYWYETFM
jgi:hypothetical protein